MYFSYLLIDTGDNPDRPRPGRAWLRNIYHVHQRLCMAFPSAERRASDPHFLKPYDRADFLRAAENEKECPRFLFRIDSGIRTGRSRALIIVQSVLEPDWDYAFHNALVFLAAPPETKRYDPCFTDGKRCRFRILVNLSKRSKAYGRRVAVTWPKEQSPDDAVRAWFAAKADERGFAVEELLVQRLGWVGGWRSKQTTEVSESQEEKRSRRLRFRSALLDGTLRVTDADRFRETLINGIGSGKAFGFGLLTVAPLP